jgi:D-sedoheptulose 7-phosphate isomerase
MLRQAAHELGFDPTASFVVGDNVGDVEMGRRVGATTFLVQTGYGTQVAREGRAQPDHLVDDLRDVATIIEGLMAGETTMDEGQEAGWRRERMRAHLLESAGVTRRVAEDCAESILAAASLMAHTFQAGGKVLLCGNGGSAADCQHMAAELVSRLTQDFVRPGLPALALTTDTSYLTAFANDCGFDDVFARQVQALGRPGDLLVGISTSGNSVNVIRAVEAARQGGVRTLTLTGSAGRLPQLGDVAIAVPSTTTQYIQEAHLVIEHILCDLVERSLFSGTEGPQRG